MNRCKAEMKYESGLLVLCFNHESCELVIQLLGLKHREEDRKLPKQQTKRKAVKLFVSKI